MRKIAAGTFVLVFGFALQATLDRGSDVEPRVLLALYVLAAICALFWTLSAEPVRRRIPVVVTTRRRLQQATAEPSQERELRAAAQNVIGELEYNRKLIEHAVSSRRYWNPARRLLIDGEWQQVYKRLAEEPGIERTYRHTERAYQELDRINYAVQDRAEDETSPMTIETPGQDGLAESLKLIRRAERALQDLVRELGRG
jgi:hypothetical protein